jgi:hypothetical protein
MRSGATISATTVAVRILLVLPRAEEAATQGTLQLETLTVPQGRLVPGCHLSPSAVVFEGNRMLGGFWAGLPITSNPWSGSDRSIAAAIRERVAVSPRPPDGPPLSESELARFRFQLVADVEQAYAAIYADDAIQPITVYAVRFSETPIPQSPDANALPKGSLRLVRDRSVVVLSANGRPCSEAVGTYLRELMAP